MEPYDPLSDLQKRRYRSNLVGCFSCAGVFLIPFMLLSSGAWSLLAGIYPLFIILLPILALGGWINAGNISKEIRSKQRVMGGNAAPTAGPSTAGSTGTTNTSATSGKPPAQSMASRLDKARRAGH
jgi:hypothetical protein